MDSIQNVLFLDIETVPMVENFSQLSDEMQRYWTEKVNKLYPTQNEVPIAQTYRNRAAIYAEYGKIICISVGYIRQKEGSSRLRIKSFADDDEKQLLEAFKTLLNRFFKTKQERFCGHNIKEFDIPYICRRMLINNIALPPSLCFAHKKPWEIPLLDTMDYWKFGDYKSYTSLKLLTEVLGVPSPKDDIDGSMVANVYYEENNLMRIATYCEKDVVATVQVWLRLNGYPLVEQNHIEFT